MEKQIKQKRGGCLMHTVLWVDCGCLPLTAIKKLLHQEKTGFVIGKSAGSIEQALTALKQRHFDVVLIHTGGFASSGLCLCEQIRAISSIPILLLGGKDDFRAARKALSYQVSDYIPGPLNPPVFVHSLIRLKWRLAGEKSSEHTTVTLPFPLRGRTLDRSDRLIEAVKAYACRRLADNVTLKEIADLLHFNCAYLGQRFKSKEKMPFNRYLLQQRMEEAKRLLENTDLRIYEIAVRVGYTDTDWFHKKFREYEGVSPNEYRKRTFVTA
ncbi:hypothetical protein B9G55_02970 [Saccharibacillus sp. O16]|nr:hypothetical protein B9G55_02970 [Saccharibacillus sp. O16]